jgi:hypothetical protein
MLVRDGFLDATPRPRLDDASGTPTPDPDKDESAERLFVLVVDCEGVLDDTDAPLWSDFIGPVALGWFEAVRAMLWSCIAVLFSVRREDAKASFGFTTFLLFTRFPPAHEGFSKSKLACLVFTAAIFPFPPLPSVTFLANSGTFSLSNPLSCSTPLSLLGSPLPKNLGDHLPLVPVLPIL